jgi:hypothetical protein
MRRRSFGARGSICRRGRETPPPVDPRSIGALLRLWSQQTIAVMRREEEAATEQVQACHP